MAWGSTWYFSAFFSSDCIEHHTPFSLQCQPLRKTLMKQLFFSTAAVLFFKLKSSLALCFYCLSTGWFGNKLHKTLLGCCTRSGPVIPRIWQRDLTYLCAIIPAHLKKRDSSCSLEHLYLHLNSWEVGVTVTFLLDYWLLIFAPRNANCTGKAGNIPRTRFVRALW